MSCQKRRLNWGIRLLSHNVWLEANKELSHGPRPKRSSSTTFWQEDFGDQSLRCMPLFYMHCTECSIVCCHDEDGGEQNAQAESQLIGPSFVRSVTSHCLKLYCHAIRSIMYMTLFIIRRFSYNSISTRPV